MAKSKYEYVKSFEFEDEVMPHILIIVRINGFDFQRYSGVHEFGSPNCEKALELMNACAVSVLEEYPDIVFSYGFSDEYSFIFKKKTQLYGRRASKISSVIVSLFSSLYATKWKEYFPKIQMRCPPSFLARVITCASIDILQEYLAWRQNDCHINNQYNACLCKLVESGKTEREAQEILKGTEKQQKNELLYQQFGINYKELSAIFRRGSCAFMTQVDDVAKYSEDGTPIERCRRKARIVHSDNIAGRSFWEMHQKLLKNIGAFADEVDKVDPSCIRSFLFESKLMPCNWIVIRIDGCHFRRFCEAHEFEKPNDEQALNLMNSCAVNVLQEFEDVVFAYGFSDEYSFVLDKDSKFYQRKASKIVSAIVSLFSATYVMNWESFFPQKELKYTPFFDGRAVCYPSYEILRDYLSWRQVDCHINNHYNTCFWVLVKSGKSKSEAYNILKGSNSREKNELLANFGINYKNLPIIFRRGSSVFRFMAQQENNKVVVEQPNIIEESFWKAHPKILV